MVSHASAKIEKHPGPVAQGVIRICVPQLGGADVHVVLLALHELHGSVSEGEQCVVLATANVVARGDVRAALANDDLAGLDGLAAKDLGAEALGVGVATVTGSTLAFLVSHSVTCSLRS